jgi:hypothetical protein
MRLRQNVSKTRWLSPARKVSSIHPSLFSPSERNRARSVFIRFSQHLAFALHEKFFWGEELRVFEASDSIDDYVFLYTKENAYNGLGKVANS